MSQWQRLYSPNDRLRSVEVGQNADGRLEVFGIASDGRVLQTWQTAPNNGWNGRWQELNPTADKFTDLRVARNQDGRLEAFAISEDNRVFQTWQTAPNNGWNGGWQALYTPEDRLSRLEVGQNADGRLEVFGIDPFNRVWQTWQTAPNNGWNGRWQELGTQIRLLIKIPTAPGTPAPTTAALDAMVANTRTVLGTAGIQISEGPRENITVNPPNGGPPQTVFNVGTCDQGTTADQNLLFANRNNAGPNDIVIYVVAGITATAPLSFVGCATFPPGQPGAIVVTGAPAWTMAHEVGHVLGLSHVAGENCATPSVTRLMTGCGTAVIIGTPTLSQGEIDAAQGSSLIGPRLRQLAVSRNADGRLEVFGVASDEPVWQTWQTAPNNGWS